MKIIIKISIFLLIFNLFACSKNENSKITTFKVWGNCDMCKNTIESSLKEKSIYLASWNDETKIITIEYDTTNINEAKLHKLIAGVGYDTEKEKGDDIAYKNLHECCQYSRKEAVK